MKNNKSEPIPVMDYRQYRRVRRLVHECCNYIDGNCIALDDGEECVCVQSISYSLLCRWFRTAVLPQDKELETALFHRLNAKKFLHFEWQFPFITKLTKLRIGTIYWISWLQSGLRGEMVQQAHAQMLMMAKLA